MDELLFYKLKGKMLTPVGVVIDPLNIELERAQMALSVSSKRTKRNRIVNSALLERVETIQAQLAKNESQLAIVYFTKK
jgi:hypothetical protein